MGDRVYASIEIGGHIDTIEQAEILIDALARECITFNGTNEIIGCFEDGQTAIRTVIEAGQTFEGHDLQANHGNFDELDAAAAELTSLWFSTAYNAGDEFSEGIKTIIGGQRLDCITNDGGAVVSLSLLEDAINGNDNDTIAYELTRIVSRVQRAAGKNLPPLTASPAVAAWLKIFGEKAA